MKLVDEICPMFGEPCRHCSDEVYREIVRFSIIKDCELGKKGHAGKRIRRTELGCFCNNDGKNFVKDMKYCPARWALTRPVTEEAQVLIDALVKQNFGKIIKKAVKKAVKKAAKKPRAKPVKKTAAKKLVKKTVTKRPVSRFPMSMSERKKI